MNAHGGASCPVWSTYYDRWTETALRHCFAVFYPIGVTDPNVADDPCMSVPGGRIINGFFSTLDCCCTKNNRRVDPIQTQDVSVLFRMVQDIAFEKRIDALSNGTASLDETRIYMGGHSNGCVAALAMGAIFSNLVAAVCCHAGGGFTQLATNYNPVPTWLAQGMKDDRIWYQFAQDTYRSYGWVHSCENETSVMVENKTAVEYTRYNCNNNATVKLFLLNESGHIPFMNGFEISEGASQTTVDTTEMAWQFCSNFSKEEIPVSLLSRSSAPSWIAKGSLVIIMIQLIIEMI
jgi:poly(3-hydroxybutyrate) depolymerase